MLTQVYEISTAEEAAAISAIGVDPVGVLEDRRPRCLGKLQFPGASFPIAVECVKKDRLAGWIVPTGVATLMSRAAPSDGQHSRYRLP